MNLPASCERALLERFLKAEAMALWSVRAAQASDVPAHVVTFLQRHEAEEQAHLKQFESMLGVQSWEKAILPRVPRQWEALAVHLYGYEVLGLEFAELLAAVRPDLSGIVEDEEVHVGFFEQELKQMPPAAARLRRPFGSPHGPGGKDCPAPSTGISATAASLSIVHVSVRPF